MQSWTISNVYGIVQDHKDLFPTDSFGLGTQTISHLMKNSDVQRNAQELWHDSQIVSFQLHFFQYS